jgi:sec-independent protein translocase protein TatB
MMMTMGPSFADTIFLFLLALIIFGPKRLPEIGRQIGKVLNELKRASNEFKSQIQTEMDSMERQENAKKALAPAQPPAGTIASLPLTPDLEFEPSAVYAPEASPFEVNSSGPSSSDLTASKAGYTEDNSAEQKTQAVIDLTPINHSEAHSESHHSESYNSESHSGDASGTNAESGVKATNV